MLNIISSKSPRKNSSCPLHDTVSPWKLEETSKHVAEFANWTLPVYHDFDTSKKNFIQTNNINGEVSQHSKSNSDVQLKNNLNIIISEKVRKLNFKKTTDWYSTNLSSKFCNSIVIRAKLLRLIITTTCKHLQRTIKQIR